MDELKKVLQQIEINLHTFKGQIEYVIVKPAERLLEPDAILTDIPGYEPLVAELSKIRIQAQTTYNRFDIIGQTSESDYRLRYKDICTQLQDIQTVIVPEIRQIVSYYSTLRDKPIFNLNTKNGNKAYNLVKRSVEEYEGLCERLVEDNAAHIKTEHSISETDLFGIVSNAFLTLQADVKYEPDFACIPISIDEARFKNEVLNNITRNIERYAFPRNKYEMATVLQKRVQITFRQIANFWEIDIANNGEPFTGDLSKVFMCGYHHGSSEGTGYGLYTARQFLQSIGGDIYMESTPNEEYKVKFTIKIKAE